MDSEMTMIWNLIGALSDAQWRRAIQPGVSALDILLATPYHPDSPEELLIWTELTAPQNYGALRRYVDRARETGANEFATKLHDALIAAAASRWECWTASHNKDKE